MTTFHNVLELEIQKREGHIKDMHAEIKVLRSIQSANKPSGSTPVEISPPRKNLSPRRVNLEIAAAGFKEMPIVFTSREYRDQLRALTNVLITRAAGYRWLRKFEHEGECAQDKSAGNFQARVWHKTEAGKAMLRLSHDRARPAAV